MAYSVLLNLICNIAEDVFFKDNFMNHPVKLLLFIFLFNTHTGMCQSNDLPILDSVCGQLIKKIRSSEKDKIFLTTDKSVYKAGETLWFRVFLLHSVSQKFTASSEHVFVDIVDENDSIVHSPLLLNPAKGLISGKISFNQSLHSGYYWIRAYNNCIEDDTANMCVVPLYVVNTVTATDDISSLRETQKNDTLLLKFFPEGGTIITGANSVVAFQTTNNKKEPISVSGTIKDNLDSVITRFSSDQYGLGVFQFFPKRYRKYSAHMYLNGAEKRFPLPPFNFYAAQLSLITKKGMPIMRVLLEDSIYSSRFKTYLIGVSKDSICFASAGMGRYEVSIPSNKFPEGIASFYLLDSSMKLLSERSVYFRDNSLIVKANVNKNALSKREKGLLTISIANSYNEAVASSLSITIADSSLLKTNTVSDFLMLANSQDADENWLLSGLENLSDAQLNELMLLRTNTFSKIKFQQVDAHCLDHSNDTLLFIRGKIINTQRKSLSNKVVDLFSNSGDFIFYKDTTNAEGEFCFNTAEYSDSTKFYIQVSGKNGNKEQCKVLLDSVIFPKPATPISLKRKLIVLPSETKMLLQGKNSYLIVGKTMDTVVVKASKKKRVSFDETKRISSFSKIVTSDKLNRGGSDAIENALLGVQGLHTINGYLVIGGFSGLAPGPNTEPIVVVDGTQAMLSAGIMGKVSPVLSFLEQLDPRNIDFIEVLSGPEAAAYGMRGGNGVILINTKNHSADGNSDQNNLISFVRRGYHFPSLFLMPDYYNDQIRKSLIADVRSTLYWSGSILTDSTGKIEIPFFTSDRPGTYKVLIKGITIHGDIIYKTIYFKVE